MPFNLSYANGIYGILSADATIIGLLNNPIIYLDRFNIKNLEVLEDRFDISLTGYYGKNEFEFKDFVMTKTGQGGMVITKAFKKPQQIRIPYAYFSKDLQNMQIEVDNLYLYSSYSGNINYNMRKLPNGISEYRIQTSPITINRRILPEFGTIMTYSDNLISFTNNKTHGINGTILREEKENKTKLNYIYDNNQMLNIDGVVRNTKNNQVDLLLTSSKLNVEIFEIFNVIFTEIQSSPTNFIIDNKPYTLYARVHGDKDNLAINGRFLGHGKKVKMAYFSDIFDNAIVDFNFDGNMFNINNLTFYTKRKKNLSVTGEAEIFRNAVNYMDFDLLSSDEQLGLLEGDIDFNVAKIKGPLHLDMNVGGNLSAPRIGGILTLMKSDIQINTINNRNTYSQHIYGIASRIYWDFIIEAWKQVRAYNALVGDFYLEEGSKMGVYSSIMDGIELTGTINLARGNIYYLQNIYKLESGSITFPNNNSSDPIIEATAFANKKYYPSTANNTSSESFENEVSRESITLYMEMNARLSQLLYPDTSGILPVRFYTIPTLGQYQVNQLAGIPQGTFDNREEQMYAQTTSYLNSRSENNNQVGQVVGSYSDLIFGNTILRPFERWIMRIGIIDSFNISSSAVNNIITYNNNLSLAKFFNNTSASIG